MFLVSYAFEDGFGQRVIKGRGLPRDAKDVERLSSLLDESTGKDGVIILAISPLPRWWEFWK